jgi:F0F1-type ATP synthase assembly protein I
MQHCQAAYTLQSLTNAAAAAAAGAHSMTIASIVAAAIIFFARSHNFSSKIGVAPPLGKCYF